MLIDPVIEQRFKALETRVESLEKTRPGRKKVPIVVKSEGVCGIDPKRDSTTCPDAGVYRFQQGCLGSACRKENDTYYKNYRTKNKKTQEVEVDG